MSFFRQLYIKALTKKLNEGNITPSEITLLQNLTQEEVIEQQKKGGGENKQPPRSEGDDTLRRRK